MSWLSSTQAVLRRRAVRDVLIVVVATLLLTAPFINKAFDWDDREYIEFGQALAQDPAHLHLDNLSYKGNFYEQFRTSHPPLLFYYLSLLFRLGIEVSEPLLRIAYLVFPLIAAVSMYSLGRRFTRYPLVTALLMSFTAGFIVTSHSLMGDMPGLAFWLAAVALFIWGADRDSWPLLAASGLVMAIAVMTAYQSLSVIPLLLLYTLVKRRFRVRVFAPFIVPLAVFGAYVYINYRLYQAPPVFSYQVGISFGLQDVPLKIRALVVFVGGATVFPLMMIPLLMRKKIDVLVAFLLLPPLLTWASIYFLGEGRLTVIQALLLAVMMTAGFLALYKLIANTVGGLWGWFKRRQGWSDSLFLLVWFSGVLIYVGVFLPFVAVRYMMPLFPPLVLLLVREAESLWPMKPRWRGIFVFAMLSLTLIWGLAAAVVDYQLAGLERYQARQLAREYGGNGKKIWVLGEFGFRYYAQKEGFEYLGVNSTASSGDLVVESTIDAADVVAPLPEGFYRILDSSDSGDGFPVRIMNPWAGSGFFAHLVGPLPVMLSRAPLDEFTVYELQW